MIHLYFWLAELTKNVSLAIRQNVVENHNHWIAGLFFQLYWLDQ